MRSVFSVVRVFLLVLHVRWLEGLATEQEDEEEEDEQDEEIEFDHGTHGRHGKRKHEKLFVFICVHL